VGKALAVHLPLHAHRQTTPTHHGLQMVVPRRLVVAQHDLVQAWWREGAGLVDLQAPRVRSNTAAQLSFATVPQPLRIASSTVDRLMFNT